MVAFRNEPEGTLGSAFPPELPERTEGCRAVRWRIQGSGLIFTWVYNIFYELGINSAPPTNGVRRLYITPL